MKTIKYLFAVTALTFAVTSCHDMDLEPKGILDEGTLLTSDYGVKKYLAAIYNDLPIEDFNYKQTGDGKGYSTNKQGSGAHDGQFWEAQKGSPSTAACETTGRDGTNGDGWGYWPYGRIRDVNNFLAAIPQYADKYTEEQLNEYLGEGHFLRAFYYFGIVKRYGGVPLIDKVQDPTAPMEELQVPRDTEYNSWKFIYEDLKFAMENMAEKSEPGRANRYAAAALMSRAMLYAASIAKYGSYMGTTGPAVTAGLMGMPSDKAQEFYQYAYDACKFIQEGGYRLHTGGDKEAAYTQVFLEDLNGEEDIFVKQYGPNATTPFNMRLYHSWDTMVLPRGTNMASSVGAAIHPVWELISLYEMPAITDENGNPVRFNSLDEIWKSPEMEPRARANFFFSGMTESVSGTVFDIQAGVYTQYPGTAADGTPEATENEYTQQYRVRASQVGESQTINGTNVKVSGQHGFATGTGDEGYRTTGVFVRKYVNYNAAPSTRDLYKSSQAFKVFRYGEILCNWAEAAYELGLLTGNDNLKAEAFTHINELRDRAGAQPHQMAGAPEDIGSALYGFPIDENLQYIRDERTRELCLENQRYWDLRRWRVADVMFNNYWPHVLYGYYVLAEQKYIYLNEVEFFGRKLTFDKKWYYEQIPDGEIKKNPNLVRNDGY